MSRRGNRDDQGVRSLHCRGYDKERIGEKELRSAFSAFGKIVDVYLPREFHTKELRGFAYIQFENEAEADAARLKLDRTDVFTDSCVVSIMWAAGERKTPTDMRRLDIQRDNPHARLERDRPGRRPDWDGEGPRDAGRDRPFGRFRDRDRHGPHYGYGGVSSYPRRSSRSPPRNRYREHDRRNDHYDHFRMRDDNRSRDRDRDFDHDRPRDRDYRYDGMRKRARSRTPSPHRGRDGHDRRRRRYSRSRSPFHRRSHSPCHDPDNLNDRDRDDRATNLGRDPEPSREREGDRGKERDSGRERERDNDRDRDRDRDVSRHRDSSKDRPAHSDMPPARDCDRDGHPPRNHGRDHGDGDHGDHNPLPPLRDVPVSETVPSSSAVHDSRDIWPGSHNARPSRHSDEDSPSGREPRDDRENFEGGPPPKFRSVAAPKLRSAPLSPVETTPESR